MPTINSAMSLQALCVKSAERYLSFLEQNELGLIPISVRQKIHLGEHVWKFDLAQKIFDLDAIRLWVNGTSYEIGEFVVDSYDEETRTLIVKLVVEIQGIEELAAIHIRIVSDLKFLARRVRDWFVSHGHQIHLPVSTVGFEFPPPPIPLNDDQHAAYIRCLSGGLNYIWGPPGTGKTRRVLTAAALRLMMEGKLVAVVTPTNNSVEVAMRSLLEAANELRDDPDIGTEERERLNVPRFLRLGSPSAAFARDYPVVCEARGIANQIKILKERSAVLKEVVRVRHNTGALENIESVLAQATETLELVQQREKIWMRLGEIGRQASACRRQMDSSMRRLLGKLTGATAKMRATLDQLLGEQEALNQALNALEARTKFLSSQIVFTRTGSELLDDLYAAFNSKSSVNVNAFVARLTTIAESTRTALNTARALAEPYTGWTLRALHAEQVNVQDELARLNGLTLDEKIKSVGVVGMTLDAFIARFADSVPFAHIFLDEAGYAPLIKSLPLLRHSIPVSLIGDHLQLPPVCEMRDQDIGMTENEPVILWAKPAIYLQKAVESTPAIEALPHWLLAHDLHDPSSIVDTTPLRETYRFGSNLAAVLDEFIYKIGFRSAEHAPIRDLVIRVVSAQRDHEGDWSNRWECAAITHQLTSDVMEKTAVLTPYRNQASLLADTLPFEFRDDVMTVHRAQGREWPTVIFSAADTARSPFLTSTDNLPGRKVLNTAVSRAQSELILVCDEPGWMARGDADRQLLCRLIQLAID